MTHHQNLDEELDEDEEEEEELDEEEELKMLYSFQLLIINQTKPLSSAVFGFLKFLLFTLFKAKW